MNPCPLLIALLAGGAQAADWFVAPGGSDADPGSRGRPFATLGRAQSAASPGDTVHLGGGTYRMNADRIAETRGMWAHVILLDKSGRPGAPIRYRAADGERPVFDFAAVKPDGLRVHAFQVSASHVHLEGIEVTGVQVTVRGHTQSICFSNTGSHNVYERLSMHDGMGIGFYLSGGSDNLVLNCDAWNNHDPVSGDRRGGNVDGFGCHPAPGGTGNVFRGCRAWFNSDDGFDCISARESVRFENCWAFYNGFSPGFRSLADGNGFKAGGYGAGATARIPARVPRHVVSRCLAVGNKNSGFYANHHPGGIDWIHNSGYRNRTDFNLLGIDPATRLDVPGRGHVMSNNLAFRGKVGLAHLDPEANTSAGNMFDEALGARDFLGLDEEELRAPRQPDGSLPEVRFLHPAPGSRLVDRGADLGRPFRGRAPDPGAFEAR